MDALCHSSMLLGSIFSLAFLALSVAGLSQLAGQVVRAKSAS